MPELVTRSYTALMFLKTTITPFRGHISIAPADLIDGDRRDNNQPIDHILPEGIYPQNIQSVSDGSHDQRADQRGDNIALAAE